MERKAWEPCVQFAQVGLKLYIVSEPVLFAQLLVQSWDEHISWHTQHTVNINNKWNSREDPEAFHLEILP